jgi:Terminase RNaseH-like domain
LSVSGGRPYSARAGHAGCTRPADIKDKGSGISLIQQLRHEQIAVLAIKCQDDKVTRLFSTQPQFESGSVHFPEQAPWLDDLIAELLAFPHGRHDDQVDSIAQALAWIAQRKRGWGEAVLAMPIIFRVGNEYREAFPDTTLCPNQQFFDILERQARPSATKGS